MAISVKVQKKPKSLYEEVFGRAATQLQEADRLEAKVNAEWAKGKLDADTYADMLSAIQQRRDKADGAIRKQVGDKPEPKPDPWKNGKRVVTVQTGRKVADKIVCIVAVVVVVCILMKTGTHP